MKIGVRCQPWFQANRPWPGISFRIRKSDEQFHAADVETAKAFGSLQGIRVRMASVIKPGLIVETCRFQDKRVAFPWADRRTHPRRAQVVGKGSSIRENLAVMIELFKAACPRFGHGDQSLNPITSAEFRKDSISPAFR
jgi:hypothetical protein